MPTRACVAAVQRNASPARTSGDNSAVAPPVPIPNTAVKRCSPDGSAAIGRARVGHRQNKNPTGFIPVGFLHFWHAHSSREHAVLKSRRVDGQARQGSGCVRGSERISRTSPEPSSESFRAWAFFVPRRVARGPVALAGADRPSISLDMDGLFPSRLTRAHKNRDAKSRVFSLRLPAP